jgi:hypothetical protein
VCNRETVIWIGAGHLFKLVTSMDAPGPLWM